MMKRCIPLLLAVGLLAVPATRASAQTDVPVSRLLSELVFEASKLGPSTANHDSHFEVAARSVAELEALSAAVGLQVASFPLGITEVGVVVGPDGQAEGTTRFVSGFTGHAGTLGRGRRGFAVTYEGATFEWIDDLNLRDSNINLFHEHTCCIGNQFERDLMHQVVSVALHRKVIGLVTSFGVTDRVDLGVVVPIVEVAADARVTSYILRTATEIEPGIHQFDEIDLGNRTLPGGNIPPLSGVAGTGSSTARGFGDLIVRGKVGVMQRGPSGVAVAVDVRLPTGDAEEYLGLGTLQVRPAVIFTAGSGRVLARGRVEYAWSGGDATFLEGANALPVPDELLFAFGVDADIAPRTTLVADFVGRQVPDLPRFDTTDTVFLNRGPGPIPSRNFTAENRLQEAGTESVSLFLGAVGGRFRVTRGRLGQRAPAVFDRRRGAPAGDVGRARAGLRILNVRRHGRTDGAGSGGNRTRPQ